MESLVKGPDGRYYSMKEYRAHKPNTWKPAPDKFARRTVALLFVIAAGILLYIHYLY